MAGTKRYYWLRLHDDFFGSKRIKKLRRMAGGDTYTIIYLKMQLLAMKTGGVLKWTGLEENIVEELALDLDEQVENVKVTMAYLLSCGLAETDDNVSFFFPYAIENTGCETASAQRVREYRSKCKALHCNNDVTELKRECNAEIEIEIEKEKKINKERARARETFTPPTVDEVKAYCTERGNNVDAERFCDFYASKGWRVGNQPMRDWKAAVRNWERSDKREKPTEKQGTFETDEFFGAALKRSYGSDGGKE